jgi:hypothetical protein
VLANAVTDGRSVECRHAASLNPDAKSHCLNPSPPFVHPFLLLKFPRGRAVPIPVPPHPEAMLMRAFRTMASSSSSSSSSPSASAAVAALRTALSRAGNDKDAVSKAAYFKHVALFWGVRASVLEELVDSHFPKSHHAVDDGTSGAGAGAGALPRAAAAEAVWADAEAMLRDPYHEMKQAGALLLYRNMRHFLPAKAAAEAHKSNTRSAPPASNAHASTSLLERLAPLFETPLTPSLMPPSSPGASASSSSSSSAGSIADWATSDSLSSRVIGALLRSDPSLASPSSPANVLLSKWAVSPHMWQRRAACVAFVRAVDPTSYPGLAEFALRVGAAALETPPTDVGAERFVQLGVGWMVREVSVAGKRAGSGSGSGSGAGAGSGDGPGSVDGKALALEFLRERYRLISREGLKYALEKLDAETRQRVMDEHKAAGARAAAGASAGKRKRGGDGGGIVAAVLAHDGGGEGMPASSRAVRQRA